MTYTKKCRKSGPFQEDFSAAPAPCAALGLAEINGHRLGLVALKPDRDIPAPVFQKGMAFGHGLLGTGRTVLCQFGFHFYDFACFTTLINPANPVMRPILLTSDLFVDLTGFLVCFQVWLLRGAL